MSRLTVRASPWLPVLVVLGLLACAPGPGGPVAREAPPAPPGGAAAPSASTPETAPPPLRKLELPTATLSATSAPLWVAADHGIYRRYGFDAEVIGLAPAAATQAVQSGSVPFAATAGSTITAFVGGARDLVLIAGVINKLLFQLVAEPSIARVEDLRGKSAGTSTAGSSTAILLAEILRRYGLEPDRDVSILYLRDQPGILSGLLSGQTPAGFLAPPYNKQALNQGYRLLVDTLDLDLEIFALGITTTRGLLEREPETARRLVMAHVEAIQYARQQRAGTVESIMRGTRSEDRALAEETYDLYRRVWDPWPSAKGVQAFLDSLEVPGAREVRPEHIVDASILRELEASGWLAQHLGSP